MKIIGWPTTVAISFDKKRIHYEFVYYSTGFLTINADDLLEWSRFR